MEKDMATLLDAVTFQVSDMMAPATVLEAAGRHLLDRLDLTDPHRWAVTSALGSITAARKALEAASEELLHVVAQDGADMLAVEVNNGEIKTDAALLDRNLTGCVYCDVRRACPYHGQPWRCASVFPLSDPALRCTRDADHAGVHSAMDASDDEFVWHPQIEAHSSVGGDGRMRRI